MHNLYPDTIEKICAEYNAGYSVSYLARKYNRDPAHIQEIIDSYLED